MRLKMSNAVLYREAIACLESTLCEGKKAVNVDIQLMLANVQQCRQVVQRLLSVEHEPLFSAALGQLIETLNGHSDILLAKIKQLDHGRLHPVLTSDRGSPANQIDIKDDAQERNRRLAIESTMISKGQVTFKDVAGLLDAKQALKEAIIMPLQFPHLFTGGRQPWRRILLYGPPGTGKSRLAQAISSEINSTFYCVSSSDLVSSWFGESEKLIKELFHHAKKQQGRSVVFIDEIDSICRRRSSGEEENTRRIKTELLKQMEGADNSAHHDKLFLLCATNCPWELDPAFLRRFQKRIYIALPNREARIQLLQIHAKDNNLSLQENDWNLLADKTDGHSGSDLANLTLGALFEPIRDLQAATHWRSLPNGNLIPCEQTFPGCMVASMSELPPEKLEPRDVTLFDFIKSLQAHRQTVTAMELQKFENFTKLFGENG